MNVVEQRIQSWITDELLMDEKLTVEADTPLLESGILDSMNLVHMVTFLESSFGIKVRDEDLVHDNFNTIRRVAAYMQSRHGADVPKDA